MHIIVRPNATGKTKELIQYSFDNNIPIFAITPHKAASIAEKSLAYFGKHVHVVTPEDLTSGDYTGDILIDDIEIVCDTLLKYFLAGSQFRIKGVTMTSD